MIDGARRTAARSALVCLVACSSPLRPPPPPPPEFSLEKLPSVCAPDTSREMACGFLFDGAACHERGEFFPMYFSRLVMVGSHVYPGPVVGLRGWSITPRTAEWVAKTGERHEWHIDVDLHSSFRSYLEVHGDARAKSRAADVCCYSKCTPLNSVSFLGEEDEMAEPSAVEELCVPAPEAGTQFPKAGSHLCPAAILFEAPPWPAGRPRPFRRMNADGMCCYAYHPGR